MKKLSPISAPGVNVYARDTVRVLGHDPGNQRNSLPMELMGQSVHRDGKKTGVTEYDLIIAFGRGITFVGSPDILRQKVPDAGHLIYEIHGECLSLLFTLDTGQLETPALMAYGEGNLFGQRFEQRRRLLSEIVGEVDLIDTGTGE
jgi:hypothetical protein